LRKIIVGLLVLLGAVYFMFTSCDDERYATSEDIRLAFSADTVMFDTIFTTIGSTTQSFKVINKYDQPLLISSIYLAGGDNSDYRLNIDGTMANEVSNVEISAHDSIYIFVEVTVDPNGVNQPMIVKDSVMFLINSNLQDVKLMAWGQDFVPVNQEVITTTTWTADKPYLVYDYAYVDSLEVLTIEPGAKIYFHSDAALYVKGTINAVGTTDNPIVFTADRLEDEYKDVPDQWYGIILFPGETENHFENVEIRNGNIGLQVGTLEYDGSANAVLHNVKIEHMSYAGIFALKSNIKATNTLVADCGYYCVTLLIGGSYEFNQCTIANYWGTYSNRTTASVVISNLLKVSEDSGWVTYMGDLTKATWKNSIIWGNRGSEIEFGNTEEAEFNYLFDHCLFKLADTINVSDTVYFKSITKNKDPLFIDYSEYNYELDTLSPAKDAGSIDYGELVPLDLNNVSRLSDDAPDLGAYERVEKVATSNAKKK
jgi:hypothetical protein